MQNLHKEVVSELNVIIDDYFTDLAKKLAKIWINFVKDNENLSKDSRYRKQEFQKIAQNFLDEVNSNPDLLQGENTSIIIDPSYEHYCDTPVILKFNGPINLAANIPHTLFIYAIPKIVMMLYDRICEEKNSLERYDLLSGEQNQHNQKVGDTPSRKKIDSLTFIGWLFEAGRSIPAELSELDVMILRTVGYIPLFESTSTLNNAQKIIRFLGLKRNTGYLNKRLSNIIKKIIWRPKFNVNVAPLGFETIYLPPIPLTTYNKLRRKHPVLDKSRVFTIWIRSGKSKKYKANMEWNEWLSKLFSNDSYQSFSEQIDSMRPNIFISGIFQLPIYSQLLDDLFSFYGAISLKFFYVTVNLHYLHVGINQAEYPIIIDTDMIYEPTNSIKLNINPRWDMSEYISENQMKLIQFFSNPRKGLATYTRLGKELGIHRIFVSKILNSLVNKKFLYYFPLFMRIGMDSRLILILKSKDSYLIDAFVSSLARSPRSVIFKSSNMAFFYLSLGRKQIDYLLQQLNLIDEEISYFTIPRASFVSDYQYLYNPLLHRMRWHRRMDDLIVFNDYL